MSSTIICSDDNFKVESVFDLAGRIRDLELIARKVNPDVYPREYPLGFFLVKYLKMQRA